MEDKQKAKNQILHLLKIKGAQTAAVLAKQLKISPMAVRQHLQTLKAEKLVIYKEEKRAIGRPVKLWQLTEQSAYLFPDSHGDLMLELLRGIENIFGEVGLEKILAERTQRQVQNYTNKLGENQTVVDRLYAFASLRSQEGYMAEVIKATDGSLLFIENHCPILTAANNCQHFCRWELELLRKIFDTTVTIERVEHIIAGDRRCAYKIHITNLNNLNI